MWVRRGLPKFDIIRGMKPDPTKMKDWQIAEAAEATLRPAADLLKELGINDDEWDAYGRHLAKVDVTKVLRRLGGGDASKAPKRAKYIDVTAITPTALGEGKTTTTLGLVEGLGLLGKKVVGRKLYRLLPLRPYSA